MLLDRLVAAFKFGLNGDAAVRHGVQVKALQCARVLAVRVAAEHLTALWPVVMAELQRVLLSACDEPPQLLLAACQLIDTLLTVLPDEFSSFGWMFVPPPPLIAAASPPSSDFAALLAPLAAQPISLDDARAAGLSHGFGGLLRPSADGRRRPLLGLHSLVDKGELAPFAAHLSAHLARSALQARGSELDSQLLDTLLGCHFLSGGEADRQLDGYIELTAPCTHSLRFQSPATAAAQDAHPCTPLPSTPLTSAAQLTPSTPTGGGARDALQSDSRGTPRQLQLEPNHSGGVGGGVSGGIIDRKGASGDLNRAADGDVHGDGVSRGDGAASSEDGARVNGAQGRDSD